MQKFKIPLIVAGVVVVSVLLYIFVIRSLSVYHAIPSSAVAVLETNDWQRFGTKLQTTGIGNRLKETYAIQKLMGELMLMQQLVSADKALNGALVSRSTVASLHLTSATDFDYLFITDLGGVNDNTLLNHIQASPKVKSVNVHLFKGEKIVDVLLRDGKQLSFAKRKNILAFSFTSFLAENAMTAMMSGENLLDSKGFKSVRANLSMRADLKLYFNFSKADVIMPVALKLNKLALLKDVTSVGEWGGFEVLLSKGKMIVNGDVAAFSNEEVKGANILKENLFAEIPGHAAYVSLSRTDTTGSPVAAGYFTGWMGSTKAFVILEPLQQNFTDQNVFILSVRNRQKAKADLMRLIVAGGAVPRAIDTLGSTEIYGLPDGAVINQVFGNSLVAFAHLFFAVKERAVIFANSADVLKLLLEKSARGETLDKNKNFVTTSYGQYGNNGALYYMDIPRSSLLTGGLLQDGSTTGTFINSFKNVLLVTNTVKKKVSVHAVFDSEGDDKAQSGLLWKTKLQTMATYAPQIVTNNATGEQEIFVQDTANNIYLLNQSGEVLFTKNIGEPILGKVYQVDYYNNGKLQYIFNSVHHLFIVDRLGNDVAAYPLRLSAPAAGGIHIIKAGGSTRYYVPCSNGSIYGYEVNGKPLPGWSPRGGVGIVAQPLQSLATKQANFIIAFNTAGRLMLLDAKGNLKWSVDNLPATGQPFSIVNHAGDFKILSAAGNQMIEVDAGGNSNAKALLDSANSFCAAMTSDTGYTYYFTSGSQVRAYSQADEFLGAANIAGANISAIEAINFGTDKYLLLRDEDQYRLYIYSTMLKPVADFTYTSSTAIAVTDLFNRREWIGISVDKGSSVSAYRIK